MEIKAEDLKKLKRYLFIKKAPKNSFLYGKDIIKFLNNTKFNPTIYLYDTHRASFVVNMNKGCKFFGSKDKKIKAHKGYELYYFNGAEDVVKHKLSVNVQIKKYFAVNSNMIETSKKIVSGEIKDKFFNKILPLLNEIFSHKEQEDVLLNIQILMKFSDYYKELIWYLSYEEEFIEMEKLLKELSMNPKLLDQFSKKDYARFKNRIKGHQLRVMNPLRKDMTLRESLNWWIELFDTYPNAIGYLEYKSPHIIPLTDNAVLEKWIREDYEETNRELVSPLSLKSLCKNVKELTTKYELIKEGKMMKHCVGGYSKKVEDNNSRIFHIDVKGEKATLEIVKHEGEIKINQLKGVCNTVKVSSEILYISYWIKKEIEKFYIDSIKDSHSGFYGEQLGLFDYQVAAINARNMGRIVHFRRERNQEVEPLRVRINRRQNRHPQGLMVAMDFEEGRLVPAQLRGEQAVARARREPLPPIDVDVVDEENISHIGELFRKERKRRFLIVAKRRGYRTPIY